jgi:glycosyltransferase involved in cell wall biosynthesis
MRRPIRVLELRSVWGTGGGPDKTILAGAKATDPSRVAVTVCYIRDARDRVFALDRQAAALGLDYVEVVERHSFDARIWPALRRVVRDRRIDIVHAHDHKTDAVTWALAKRDAVVPLSTAHGFAGEHWNERAYYAIEKRLLARFPRVIAVSEPIKRELVRTGSKPERVTVINNAIDQRVFRRDPAVRDNTRRALGFDSEDTVIGAVGRLEAEKRFDLLLEAFRDLRERHPRAILVIVGEGSLRTDLEAGITRLNLRGSVRLLGYRTDIVQLHDAFDAFVQSSEREGTPNSVLEAMAMETPLVATEVGGTGELVTNGVHGLLVPRHDLSAMTKALDAVLSDRGGAASRAAAARARVELDLSFERRVQHVEAIYDELLGNDPAVSAPH